MIPIQDIAFDKIILSIPHAHRLGLRLYEKTATGLTIEMPYNPELETFPNSGIIANGAITALLDTALGAATYAQLKSYRRIVTLDLRVDYFEKPEPYSSVIVKTRCLKKADQIIFVQGDVFSKGETKPIAHGVGVFSYAEMTASEEMSENDIQDEDPPL
ncbi:MAG: PaaI family thioesterase [Emcibacter sp.]|nr:PaaI family thioesterase [Emcibacter sp.]